jgi:hypothetical protein
MTMLPVGEHGDRLLEAVDRFISRVGAELDKLCSSQDGIQTELRGLKEEMRLFGQHVQALEEAMRPFLEEMRLYAAEPRAAKTLQHDSPAPRNDAQCFAEEIREDRREMNLRWGEIANKHGTMVRDLVYPSLERIVREMFHQEIHELSARSICRLPDGRMKDFDAIAVTRELVCLNSSRGTLSNPDVDAFITEIASFRECFPEYRDLPLVGILATLAVEENVLSYAEKQGFLVLAVGDEIMEVKNRPGFEPKRW